MTPRTAQSKVPVAADLRAGEVPSTSGAIRRFRVARLRIDARQSAAASRDRIKRI